VYVFVCLTWCSVNVVVFYSYIINLVATLLFLVCVDFVPDKLMSISNHICVVYRPEYMPT